jgi:hypothetical protein
MKREYTQIAEHINCENIWQTLVGTQGRSGWIFLQSGALRSCAV